MSDLYQDCPNTGFPETIDEWERFLDPTLSELTAIKRYTSLYSAGNIAAANDVLETNPILKRMCVNADNLNKLRDGIIALQRYYTSDVQQYLVNIVKPKGTWSNTAKYTKYNTVQYKEDDAVETYMAIKTDVPVGTLPTDSNWFVRLTMRGDKGESGTGLTPRGVWNSETKYYTDDMVSHSNALWYCVSEHTGMVPNKQGSAWSFLMEFSPDMQTYNNASSGLAAETVQAAIDEVAAGHQNHADTKGKLHIPDGGASGQILRWGSDGTAVWGKVDEYVHPTSPGYRHVPAGGASGQILRWESSGTAKWDKVDEYVHPNSGAAPGTYRSVTVNALGHVTAGSNPTLAVSAGGTGATTAAGAISNLGITATAGELNFVKGVTSGIQAQLNGKAASSHSHNYLPLSGGTVSGNLTVSGTITGSKVYGAVYNDLAEWFPRQDLTEEFEPGDVVVWDQTGVVKAKEACSPAVVGAYSDSYSTILGGEALEHMEDNIRNFLPIGLAGRIYVKVTGEVKVGDFLVSSNIPGVAAADNQASARVVLGKALGSAADDGAVHKILMLIK